MERKRIERTELYTSKANSIMSLFCEVEFEKEKLMLNKWHKVLKSIRGLDSAVIAFSGGMDSTLAAKAASLVLKDRILAVTLTSEIFPSSDSKRAEEMACQLGIRHVFAQNPVLEEECFLINPPDRCYHCKKHMLEILQGICLEQGYSFILDGTNADDIYDCRPGLKANQEMGVISPLKEAGLTKREIFLLSAHFELPLVPENACLASRVPYGSPITRGKLAQVERAENFLHSLGFKQCRVRHHEDTARIEVLEDDLERVMDPEDRKAIYYALRDIGFTFVSLDLGGYRPGNLNKLVPKGDN